MTKNQFRVGDKVIFNDPAWLESHQGVSEFSGRVGILMAPRGPTFGTTFGTTWSVYYADDDFAYGIHETWLLPIFLVEELP